MASSRAIEAWKRFAAWYGADALERKYGLKPPEDWCEIFDLLDRDQLARVMAETKAKFPTWMPGLGEFELIVGEIRRPAPSRGPTLQEQLLLYVLRNYQLTWEQRRSPWKWLGGEGDVITGVVVPADGNSPSYRVMVVDMQSEAA